MLRTEAIKTFLLNSTHKDLAELYTHDMEVQVNVAQDNGSRITGEYKGKQWWGWTDGESTWKSFRIPYNASTNPQYTDKNINFNLAEHVEAIGMTGWDWFNCRSFWVAYDFDSIVDHKSGLSTEELITIQERACQIPWITVRKSTSGNGIHLYVFFGVNPTTNNHNEHQALGRAVLGMIAAETGYDFVNKVDICGSNMWVWHRKMTKTSGGLSLIKQGDPLFDIPPNWRDHIKVITGHRRKNLPQKIEDQVSETSEIDRLFAELTGQYIKEKLDETHKKLLTYLKDNECLWWWDQDNYMLVTHTVHLKEAHDVLGFRGIFNTVSEGKDWGRDHNCFAFPLRKGGWVVRRFTPGVREHSSWDQDGSGWTRCYYNVDPDLSMSARNYEGVEHPSGGYVFREAESAQKAAQALGADLGLPNWALGRSTKLKVHKDGRLIAEMHKETTDNPERMRGWIPEGTKWKRILNIHPADNIENEQKNFDDIIRHLTTTGNVDSGWVVKADGGWVEEPLVHVKMALKSLGVADKDANAILGNNIFKRWTIVNKPFQPEYPGDRQWNKNACQFNFYPSKSDDLYYPTWTAMLEHVGTNLTPSIMEFKWAQDNGILTGADYLKCWIASLFQFPEEPLPYLFLFGPEASGKSVFHEALSLLISPSGYHRAERALLSEQGFNGELKSAIICVIEETNLSQKNKTAYNRIKDWVTSPLIPIHPKGGTPYLVDNTTHWIQCSNDITYCPVFPGDTRITMIHVGEVPRTQWEAKRDLFLKFRKEAPDFLGELMRLELPRSPDRLNLPVIATSEKEILQKQNQTALEQFIEEQCFHAPGYMVKLSTFYEHFMKWLDPAEAVNWSKHKIGRSLNLPYIKGRNPTDQQFYIGNLSLTKPEHERTVLIVVNDRLVQKC